MHENRELPYFSLRQIDLPEVVKWQVGGQYYVLMKVEMTGIRNMPYMEQESDRPKLEGDFKMLSVRAVDSNPIDTKAIEKQEFENMVGKVKSGEL